LLSDFAFLQASEKTIKSQPTETNLSEASQEKALDFTRNKNEPKPE
jgi:hypothetical protein